MSKFIIRRIGYSLLSLALLSLTIFLFVRLTGDPAVLFVEPGASQSDLDAIRHQFGLDQPIWYQYVTFIASLVQGVVLMGGSMIVVVNLLIDVLYAVIDPRIRLGV